MFVFGLGIFVFNFCILVFMLEIEWGLFGLGLSRKDNLFEVKLRRIKCFGLGLSEGV